MGLGSAESHLLLTGMNILPNTQTPNSSPQNPNLRSSPIAGGGREHAESISGSSLTRLKKKFFFVNGLLEPFLLFTP